MSKERIALIIDTSDKERELLEGLLPDGVVAISVEDVRAAVAVIKGGMLPTLVILDAGEDREKTLRSIARIKKHADSSPVILVDSVVTKDYSSKYLRAGVSDYIYRPISPKAAKHRIERIIKDHIDAVGFEEQVVLISGELKGERQRHRKITMQILSALASTIDAKDEYTRGHSGRVSIYSLAIARASGCFSEKELEVLAQASLLHDVGKIGISDAIIRKPGRLSEEEFKVIQNHPIIGWDILKGVSLLPGISWVARWHHERFDGGGYPDGISGDAIPPMVRIVTIADAYDAMTSDRSYRGALGAEKAILELKNGRGHQFDPYLVDEAVRLIENGGLTDGYDEKGIL